MTYSLMVAEPCLLRSSLSLRDLPRNASTSVIMQGECT